jgi:hypothetical protein
MKQRCSTRVLISGGGPVGPSAAVEHFPPAEVERSQDKVKKVRNDRKGAPAGPPLRRDPGRRGPVAPRSGSVRHGPGGSSLGRRPTPDRETKWRLLAALGRPEDLALPMVTLLDGHPHTLAFLTGVHQVRRVHLGVTRFWRSNDLASVYAYRGIDTDAISEQRWTWWTELDMPAPTTAEMQ